MRAARVSRHLTLRAVSLDWRVFSAQSTVSTWLLRACVRASRWWVVVGGGWWCWVTGGGCWWELVGTFLFACRMSFVFLRAQVLVVVSGWRGGQLLNTISQGIVSSPRCACASRVHLFCVYAASRSKIIGRNHGFWMLCLSFFTCCATFASKPWVTPPPIHDTTLTSLGSHHKDRC